MKLLILGGYGVFGGRLAELLADRSELNILIAGRTFVKAERFCQKLNGQATFQPVTLDRADIANGLRDHKPDVVIDASGPFQEYGEEPYAVVKACLNARTHYLDFADGADFVFDMSQFDEAARKAGLVILSGVSSFPVLTSAVLQVLGKDMSIRKITGGIAPSPYAGIGLNVMKAVIGYAGGPVKLTRNGHAHTAKGLTESLRYTVAPPGYLPLHNLHFSLVDVPDLQVLPKDNPNITDIWMGAGPVPESLHRILNGLAKLRALFRLPSFVRFAPLFYRVLNLLKFGEHRGGMFVEAVGEKDGDTLTRSWHLLAEGDDGPYIPSMAVEALIRNWLKGCSPPPGARPATHDLELSDYDSLFATRTIYTGFREDRAEPRPFKQVLGAAFETLPATLQDLHSLDSRATWSGQATVKRGNHPLARLIAASVGINIKSGRMPVTVTLERKDNQEIWTRNFGGRTFSSRLAAGTGRNRHLITEQFGAFKIAMALIVKDNKLIFRPRRWTVFGCPMPQWLLPRGDSFEYEKDGTFHFDVTMRVPFIGLIAAYKGALKRTG